MFKVFLKAVQNSDTILILKERNNKKVRNLKYYNIIKIVKVLKSQKTIISHLLILILKRKNI